MLMLNAESISVLLLSTQILDLHHSLHEYDMVFLFLSSNKCVLPKQVTCLVDLAMSLYVREYKPDL